MTAQLRSTPMRYNLRKYLLHPFNRGVTGLLDGHGVVYLFSLLSLQQYFKVVCKVEAIYLGTASRKPKPTEKRVQINSGLKSAE
eukprot:711914-Prorocentrum_minimum.AAC.1